MLTASNRSKQSKISPHCACGNASQATSDAGQRSLLQDKSSTASNLKIAALQFLRLGMQSTDAAIWQQHVPKLAGLVASSAEQRYYKVSAEALRVIAAMVPVIRPQGSTAPVAELKVGLLTQHGPLGRAWISRLHALMGSLERGVSVQACTHVAVGRGPADAC